MLKNPGFRVVLIVLLLALALGLAAPAAAGPRTGSQTGEHGMGLVLSEPDPAHKLDLSGSGGRRLAASIDLSGYLPPVGDQGAHSSCVGWATGYYGKTWQEKVEHPSWDLGNQQYQMSPQYVWNAINGGQDVGTSILDAMDFLVSSGCTDWEQFTYDGNPAKQPNATAVEAAKQYKIAGYEWLFHSMTPRGPSIITDCKQVLNSGMPLIMGIPICDDFPDYGGNPKSLFYDYDGWSAELGGHAVFIAGYDDSAGGGQGGFLMVNSWGASWNYSGRVYLSYDFVQNYVYEGWCMGDLDSSPSLTGVAPAGADAGQVVTITGNNLGADRRSACIGFAGGAAGQVQSWTNTQVKVRVPSAAQTGLLYAYDWALEQSNGKAFAMGEQSFAGANWLLAEGATWPGFDEWVLLQNPNNDASTVSVAFLTPQGPVGGPTVTVPAMSRTTLHVNEYIPNADVSTALTVTSGATICAERAMYFSSPDGKWGSHDSTAAPGVATTWYLAEGATWPGYDEWILVMNPFASVVEAAVTFQTPQGEVPGPILQLAPNSRQSIHVNDHLQNRDVSARVQCTTEGYGIVVERSMYINTPDGKLGCHNSTGVTETAAGWGLAEGATWPGFEEWVLVQNPAGSAASISLYFLTPEYIYEGPKFTLSPGQRESVRVNDYCPNEDVSTLVYTNDQSQKIVAERAMYIAANGKRGAHNSPGSLYASTHWLLPEGCTASGFDEWVLVMNPYSDVNAEVQLTFMTQGGAVQGPSATLPPYSRVTFHVNDYVSGDVSTLVASDEYVVAERAMYISTYQGKRGSTCSLGVLQSLLGAADGGMGAGAVPIGRLTPLQAAELEAQAR